MNGGLAYGGQEESAAPARPGPENFAASLLVLWCGTHWCRYFRRMAANALLKKRMADLGLTQEELAARMNDVILKVTGRPGDVSDRTVRNLLSGSTVRPIARTCAALEAVFSCHVEDLGFKPPRSAAPQEDPVRRRTFMASAAGTATAGLAPALVGPKRVGSSDVARLETKFAAIIAEDHRYGGLVSTETRASAMAGEALSLLQRGSTSQRVRNKLYASAAGFTSSAMWAAIDGRRFNEAQRYLDRASTLAAMSGDATIMFRIWSHAGTLYRHLGRPIDALAANDVARGLPVARRDPMFASSGTRGTRRFSVSHGTRWPLSVPSPGRRLPTAVPIRTPNDPRGSRRSTTRPRSRASPSPRTWHSATSSGPRLMPTAVSPVSAPT